MTGEPALVESFLSGEDIHTRTAAEVFDTRLDMVTPELRRRAKMVNFGILYGISGFGLASRLGNVHPALSDGIISRTSTVTLRLMIFTKRSSVKPKRSGKSLRPFGCFGKFRSARNSTTIT